MAKLKYKTKADSSPQGKERVYFACHPEDFKTYFEPICNDIFRTQNCAIYYNEEPGIPWDKETMDLKLGQMKLIVIPVTMKFLFLPNEARETEFRYAMERHIPVLPLLQDSGMESEFNRICGDLQLLDKNAAVNDPTVLPYEQKLEQFLQTVLLGDSLTAQIREAFDAYIFLSYRKKDRKYAQKLMRLIHENEFCRDIAIWYDETLVPGEDFNQAIADALTKSKLFALAVTPNLLEPDNYVMMTEYVEARKQGKPIIPAELVPTSRESLRRCYEGIPIPTDAYDAPALSEALLARLRGLALDENNSDPKHLFFIGLAYFAGIDVEVDRRRGIKLIEEAANSGIPEAMKKMSEIYQHGDGVPSDEAAAVHWMEKAVACWEKRYAKSRTNDDATQLFLALQRAGDAWKDMGRLSQSKKYYERMLELFGNSPNSAVRTVIFEGLGDISRAEGNLPEAKKWFEKDCILREQIFKERKTTANGRHLAIAYGRMGVVCEEELQLSEARLWYQKQVSLYEQIAGKTGKPDDRRRLLAGYNNMGNLYMKENKLSAAKKWYLKSLELSEQLLREEEALYNMIALSSCYDRQYYICAKEGQLPEAREWAEKTAELIRQIRRRIDNVINREAQAISYAKLGSLCLAEKNPAGARNWYTISLEMSEQLCSETETAENRRKVARCYEGLGDVCRAERNPASAEEWYEKALALYEEIYAGTGKPAFYGNVADLYHKLGDLVPEMPDLKLLEKAEAIAAVLAEKYPDVAKFAEGKHVLSLRTEEARQQENTLEKLRKRSSQYVQQGNLNIGMGLKGLLFIARESFEYAAVLAKRIYRETEEAEDSLNLTKYYIKLGDICKAEQNPTEAKKWYKKSLTLREQLAQAMGTEEALRYLANNYERLAKLCRAEGDSAEAEKLNEKAMKIRESIA